VDDDDDLEDEEEEKGKKGVSDSNGAIGHLLKTLCGHRMLLRDCGMATLEDFIHIINTTGLYCKMAFI